MKNEIENLRAEWRALEVCWRETRGGWNDSVAWRFEREFWEPLQHATNKMLRETEELSGRLERVGKKTNS